LVNSWLDEDAQLCITIDVLYDFLFMMLAWFLIPAELEAALLNSGRDIWIQDSECRELEIKGVDF